MDREKGAAAGTAARGRARRRLALAVVSAIVVSLAALLVLRLRPPQTEAEARHRLTRFRPTPGEVNVVFVTIDTLRADRLGCYGFQGISTPVIDALARDGVLFEQATATVPLTFPAHASIFTGRVPPHHGVRDNGGFFLEDSETTLAERLQQAGYATGGFVAAWVLESRWGLSQGFDHYSDRFDLSQYKILSLGTVQKQGDEVMNDALAWLETVKQRKFFAWVHLYDPHAPYEPPEPYKSRYPEQPYLGEVAYTDHVVGRLVEWLNGNGLMGRTVVVLTADHGESLAEHGESTHGYFIYDSTTHVPLVVRTPWGLRGRSRTQVAQVDIMPTVLDLVGLAPQEGIDGHSLARALFDPAADLGHVAYSETYYPRYHFGWQHLQGLRDGKQQFIEAPQPELYDLARDPGEATNIYKAFSKRAEVLRLAMQPLAKAAGGAAPERKGLDPETLQRLAALGYVGNVADADPNAVLPDPKEKLRVYALMNAAKRAGQEERIDEAIAKMRAVIREDSGIMDAHLTIGNWLARAGKTDEAIAAYKDALALKPDDETAMVNLANIYRQRGRTDDELAALEIFKAALKVNARNPQAWYQLATLYLDLGRLGDAQATFKEALQSNPKMGAAYNALGAIAFQKEDVDGAERLIRQGLDLEPEVRTGSYNLGCILETRGRLAEAEALYRRELASYPDHGRARFNLAQMLRARGDRQGYLAELRRSVEKAPKFGAAYFYLAREQLGAGDLGEALDLARRGLEAEPRSPVAALGHYVLADVYNRQGRPADAGAEVAKARKLEAELRRRPEARI
jgi:arylsulfatase A-like enzyme/Flp pilus assembly protein TadD